MKGKQKLGLWSAIAFLSLLLAIFFSPVNAVPRQQEFTSFADWCANKANLHPETRLTVDVLLQEAGTTDCNQANQKLSALTNLSLFNNQISDIKPLSNLTNLTNLSLSFNQISDIKPLSNLTNLTSLYLLSNQISDIKTLSNLTNLTNLNLFSNPIVDKTCPVKPESICRFSAPR